MPEDKPMLAEVNEKAREIKLSDAGLLLAGLSVPDGALEAILLRASCSAISSSAECVDSMRRIHLLRRTCVLADDSIT